jgi:hypothetical protein
MLSDRRSPSCGIDEPSRRSRKAEAGLGDLEGALTAAQRF